MPPSTSTSPQARVEIDGPQHNVQIRGDDANGIIGISSNLFTINTTALPTGYGRVLTYGGPLFETQVTLEQPLEVTIEDNTTNGAWGGVKLGSFGRAGYYLMYGGGIRNAGITAASGIGATAVINAAIGSTLVDGNLATPATDGALQTTDQNIVSNATLTLASSTNANEFGWQHLAKVSASSGELDLSSTQDVYLNFGIDAGDATANSTLTLAAGTSFVFRWMYGGAVAAKD